jgi:hypothetical protein
LLCSAAERRVRLPCISTALRPDAVPSCRASMIRIEGVSLEHSGGPKDQRGAAGPRCVDISGGNLILQSCMVSSKDGSGLMVHGPASATLRESKLNGSGRCGVIAFEGASLVCENCEYDCPSDVTHSLILAKQEAADCARASGVVPDVSARDQILGERTERNRYPKRLFDEGNQCPTAFAKSEPASFSLRGGPVRAALPPALPHQVNYSAAKRPHCANAHLRCRQNAAA